MTQPDAVSYSLIVHNANGVYEPAISKNIEQWSNTWNTLFEYLLGFNPWYILDIVYNIIIVTPYILPLTTPYTFPRIAAKTTHSTVATIPSTAPTICDVILNISSPFVYLGSILSLNFTLSIFHLILFLKLYHIYY